MLTDLWGQGWYTERNRTQLDWLTPARRRPMAIDTSIYGTRTEADDYFASRLHSDPWDDLHGGGSD